MSVRVEGQQSCPHGATPATCQACIYDGTYDGARGLVIPPDDPYADANNAANAKTPTRQGVTAFDAFSASRTDREGDGWPALGSAALVGLAGEVVAAVEPHTEADPAGVLGVFLAEFGALVGAGPHMMAGDQQHPARLYVVLVGRTSRGRKGTATAAVNRLMEAADGSFMADRTLSGLASGEGLIAALQGDDPRALAVAPEYGRVLKVCARDGSTLSDALRELYDSGSVRVMTRKDPLRADRAHLAVVGNITVEELRRHLSDTDAANGYANRFLHLLVRRSKRLPEGGSLPFDTVRTLGAKVANAAAAARKVAQMRRTAEAAEVWAEYYCSLDDDADGLLGAMTARAEAAMLRLSVVYALLDGLAVILPEHVHAAHAVWTYAEDSVAYIFGDALGDPVADRLLAALRQAGAAGLTGEQQRNVFSRNVTAERLAQARDRLDQRGLAHTVTEKTGGPGRPRIITRAVTPEDPT